MKGIDISSVQSNIDFNKVKVSGIEIVYIKSTEGLTYDNPSMRSQYNNAKCAGLKVGFYHYLRANDAVQEAEHMLRATQNLQVDCKYIIDVEEVLGQTNAQINSNVRRFADYLISKGLEVGIYTGDCFYATVLDCTVKNIPLWVAHYGVNKPDATNYVGFQFTDSGRVDGINDYCDIDEFSDGILNNNIVTMGNIVRSVENMCIKQGENSRRVRLLQAILNVIFVNSVKPDGDFGLITFNVVTRYQKAMGLSADGVVGVDTISMLMLDIKNNYFKL